MSLDGSVIFAPAGRLEPEALRHLRPGGTLAINAVYMSPRPEFRYELIPPRGGTEYLYGERTLRSVANSTRQDADEFLQLAAQIPLHTEVQVVPLNEANVALRRLKRGEVRGSVVLAVDRG